jgi:hypothetical protein
MRGACEITLGYPVPEQLVSVDVPIGLDPGSRRECCCVGEGFQTCVHHSADVAAGFADPAEFRGFEGLVAYRESGRLRTLRAE